MQHLEEVAWEHLRADFCQKITELCAMIKSETACKSIGDVPVSGSAFAEYIKSVTESLNRNERVSIVDSLTSGLKHAAQCSLDKALKMYDNETLQAQHPLPILHDLLEKNHKKIFTHCNNQLLKSLNGANSLTQPYLESFSREVQNRMSSLRADNSNKIKVHFKKNLDRLWKRDVEKFISADYSSPNVDVEFSEAFASLKRSHTKEARFGECVEKKSAFDEWQCSKGVANLITQVKNQVAEIKMKIVSAKISEQEEQTRKEMESKHNVIRVCFFIFVLIY
jgi:hypothetical protein